MIKDTHDGVIVECDVCKRCMDADGYASTCKTVFRDKRDAGLFVSDNEWERIGDYVVCQECVGRINRGEVSVVFATSKEGGAE